MPTAREANALLKLALHALIVSQGVGLEMQEATMGALDDLKDQLTRISNQGGELHLLITQIHGQVMNPNRNEDALRALATQAKGIADSQRTDLADLKSSVETQTAPTQVPAGTIPPPDASGVPGAAQPPAADTTVMNPTGAGDVGAGIVDTNPITSTGGANPSDMPPPVDNSAVSGGTDNPATGAVNPAPAAPDAGPTVGEQADTQPAVGGPSEPVATDTGGQNPPAAPAEAPPPAEAAPELAEAAAPSEPAPAGGGEPPSIPV